MWDNFGQQLYDNLILNDRWKLYLTGLKNTLLITLGAAIIGIILGSLVAICKVYAAENKKLRPLEILCDLYLTVVRGTPMMVQVMIFVFVLGASAKMSATIYIATLAFGINSGA